MVRIAKATVCTVIFDTVVKPGFTESPLYTENKVKVCLSVGV